MAKTRVLFVVPLLRRAGAETQVVTLANRLPGDRFEKYLLSYRPGDDLKDDVSLENVHLHELERRGRLDLRTARRIGGIIDEAEIDIVHCTLQNALLYGYLGRYFADRNPKLIASIHTTKNADLKLDLADRFVYVPLFRKCDQIWFVSELQAGLWMERHAFIAERARVVHNGIDTAIFDPAHFVEAGKELRGSLGISETMPLLCSVAGFRHEKLHSVLIESIRMVQREGLDCGLLLAGAGPTEPAIRRQVSRLGLEKAVFFLGSLADVRPVLAAADCKVLVSAAETFSMAMLEAMAMRVPVITTSVGGAREAIDDGSSGYLVKPGDPGALADRIRRIISDSGLRESMGRAGRAAVTDRFSVDRMIQRSAALLLE
jgi:glycosyltransferase involved in cell wall biosynthesis